MSMCHLKRDQRQRQWWLDRLRVSKLINSKRESSISKRLSLEQACCKMTSSGHLRRIPKRTRSSMEVKSWLRSNWSEMSTSCWMKWWIIAVRRSWSFNTLSRYLTWLCSKSKNTGGWRKLENYNTKALKREIHMIILRFKSKLKQPITVHFIILLQTLVFRCIKNLWDSNLALRKMMYKNYKLQVKIHYNCHRKILHNHQVIAFHSSLHHSLV